MIIDPPIDEIRRVRHEISAAYEHDPAKLIMHYRELQKDFTGGLFNFGASETIVSSGAGGKAAGSDVSLPTDAPLTDTARD